MFREKVVGAAAEVIDPAEGAMAVSEQYQPAGCFVREQYDVTVEEAQGIFATHLRPRIC